jgi:tyrosine-protein kinase Etk/Wzc
LKVILVEADPQAGALHRLLKRPPAPGMLDYLSGQAGLPEIVQTTEISDLKFIGAGSNSGESDDLFLCSRIDDFFSELRKDCDFIILDGAPILAADDAALLVPHADSVVLVVRPFFTRSRAVRQALDMLYQRKARQVSIVLNRARSDDFARNYGQNGMRKASSRTAAAAA